MRLDRKMATPQNRHQAPPSNACWYTEGHRKVERTHATQLEPETVTKHARVDKNKSGSKGFANPTACGHVAWLNMQCPHQLWLGQVEGPTRTQYLAQMRAFWIHIFGYSFRAPGNNNNHNFQGLETLLEAPWNQDGRGDDDGHHDDDGGQ